jgi:hypothetical protein
VASLIVRETSLIVREVSLIARAIAVLAVAWCVGIGVWLWVTPWSPGVSFADVSMLGAVPLVIPVGIAFVGAWGTWRRRWWPVVLSMVMMTAFVFLAGFSIGAAYTPAAGALAWALAAQVDSNSERRRTMNEARER